MGLIGHRHIGPLSPIGPIRISSCARPFRLLARHSARIPPLQWQNKEKNLVEQEHDEKDVPSMTWILAPLLELLELLPYLLYCTRRPVFFIVLL
jgi:hypothetical protein